MTDPIYQRTAKEVMERNFPQASEVHVVVVGANGGTVHVGGARKADTPQDRLDRRQDAILRAATDDLP